MNTTKHSLKYLYILNVQTLIVTIIMIILRYKKRMDTHTHTRNMFMHECSKLAEYSVLTVQRVLKVHLYEMLVVKDGESIIYQCDISTWVLNPLRTRNHPSTSPLLLFSSPSPFFLPSQIQLGGLGSAVSFPSG